MLDLLCRLYCEHYYPPRRPGESSLVCLAFNISSELLSECGQLWYGRSLRDQNRSASEACVYRTAPLNFRTGWLAHSLRDVFPRTVSM